VIRAAVLDELDVLITAHRLHDHPLHPVPIDRAIEKYPIRYVAQLPGNLMALIVRWKRGEQDHVGIMFNAILQNPDQSARRRHAAAHELAHDLCDHKGSLLYMQGTSEDLSRCGSVLGQRQEQECEYVAAYLLVPMLALFEAEGETIESAAASLDVPPHLVALRLNIWHRHTR
jgi:hypothetical protein